MTFTYQSRAERVILYGRVSSQQQADQYGLKTQLEACRSLAEQQNWEVVATYSDTISGVKITRNGLDQLREDIRLGKATAVVAYHLDRLNRDPAHHFLFLEEMKKAGARIYYATKGGRPVAETDDDAFLEHIEALVAFRERSRIRSRTLDARRQKARDGKLIGNGQPPFGYKRVGEKGHYAWEIVEGQAKVVRDIFAWYTEGVGVYTIVRRLTDRKTPTPADWRAETKKVSKKRDYGEWNTSTVYKILRTHAYSGTGHTFRQQVVGETANGKKKFAVRDPKDWFSFICPAIIDPDTWKKTQAKLEDGKAQSPRNSKYEYLLARRIRCGECRSAVAGRPAYRGQYLYYTCGASKALNYVAGVECDMPNGRVREIDIIVWDWVVGVLLDEASLRERSADAPDNTARRERVEEQRITVAALIADLALERKKLRTMLRQERITEAEYDEDRRELDEREASLTAELEELNEELDELEEPPSLEENLETAATLRVKADNADFETRRDILDDLAVRVVLLRRDGWLMAEVASSTFRIAELIPLYTLSPQR